MSKKILALQRKTSRPARHLYKVENLFRPKSGVHKLPRVGSGNSEPPIPEILSRFVFSGKVSSRLR